MDLLGLQHLNGGHVPFSAAGNAPGLPLPAGISGETPFRSADPNDFAHTLMRAREVSQNAPAPRASTRGEIDRSSELFELCMELETFLIKNLVKSMRSTVQKSNLIDTGFAGEIYEDMLYDEYAKDFARNAGFGFAEMAYRELTGQLR